MTTSTTKHTAGSWEVSRDAVPEWHKQFTVHSEQGERVATVFLDEANARLIAAAPELLSAIVELLDACPTSCEDRRLNDAQRAAERAIRKVNGGN